MITSKKSFLLLDVREDYELAYGKIKDAFWIPSSTFDDFFDLDEESFLRKYSFSKPSKEVEIVLYCRSGYRSDILAKVLESKGYLASNYVDGIIGWADVDNSVEKY